MNDIALSSSPIEAPVTELLSIDGETTKDIDDAMWVKRTSDGYLVDVYISNVSKAIPKDSKIDLRARRNAFSIYRGAHGCIRPMIRRDLSEETLSLTENESRQALGIHLKLNAELAVRSITFSQPTVVNKNRLSHAMADSIMQSGDSSDIKTALTMMMDAARGLLNLRRAAGALAFYDVAKGIMVNEDGQLIKVAHENCFHSQVVVQEFMILANAACAGYCTKHGIPVLYRNHVVAADSPESSALAAEISYALEANDAGLIEILGKRIMRIMTKATMGHEPLGHYALNLPAYAYFTSPIRRYPDLVNHRMLLAHIEGLDSLYTTSDLEALAAEYNEAIADEADKTSKFHREAVDRKCEKAILNNTLSTMGETDFYRVVRYLTGADLPIPDNFIAEWNNRLTSGTITTRLIAALLGGLSHRMTDPITRETLLYLGRNVHLVPSVWDTLAQKYDQKIPVVRIKEADGNFEASATGEFMGVPVSVHHLFEKTKRKAEQNVLLGALHSYFNHQPMGEPLNTQETETKSIAVIASSTDADKSDQIINSLLAEASRNYKGELMELCQKSRWPMPEFRAGANGPDHQKTFVATVTIKANDRVYSSKGVQAPSKKEAERVAARAWLEEHEYLVSSIVVKESKVQVVAQQNPINQLQEMFQQGLMSSPEYTIVPKASLFECNVAVTRNNKMTDASALGATKKEAKSKAAASLLEALVR